MVYLHLTHGRTGPDEQLSDWGRDGPCLGPFRWVHLTYCIDLHAEEESGQACQFEIVADLIYYDGLFFGAYTILPEPEVQAAGCPAPETFDEAKARARR